MQQVFIAFLDGWDERISTTILWHSKQLNRFLFRLSLTSATLWGLSTFFKHHLFHFFVWNNRNLEKFAMYYTHIVQKCVILCQSGQHWHCIRKPGDSWGNVFFLFVPGQLFGCFLLHNCFNFFFVSNCCKLFLRSLMSCNWMLQTDINAD